MIAFREAVLATATFRNSSMVGRTLGDYRIEEQIGSRRNTFVKSRLESIALMRSLRPITRLMLLAALCAPAAIGAQPAPQTAPETAPQRARSPRNASYSIDVTLDPARRLLSGREVIVWRNTTSRQATDLQFHLYYNAWRNVRSTWMREWLLGREGANSMREALPSAWLRQQLLPRPDDLASRPPEDWGSIDVSAIRLLDAGGTPFVDLTSGKRFIAPDDGNRDDQTVLAVPLPRPAGPGETIAIEVAWSSRIPRPFARTGAIGNYFFIAQWFPKLGVLEETGWNCHQFHAQTEFFSDYGVYDVRIRVPSGWPVGATGTERRRTDHADNTTTHEYSEADVHDFAWTTSPDYIERRARFDHERLPTVEMRLLLQPEHTGQADRHFSATRAALKHYGEWYGAYPYGHITIVDPAYQSGAGGMEYPTLFTAGTRWLAPREVTRPDSVTVHEAGHQFWYGIVGNNEFEHAWLDEGLNTFSQGRVVDRIYEPNYFEKRYFGGFVPYVFRDIALSGTTHGNRLALYRMAARMDSQSTPSFKYWPTTSFRITYEKTSLWLQTLEGLVGWPALQRTMSTFFDRWSFRHPKPDDFFAVANEVSGRDLTWFFDQVHRRADVFDYGVDQLTSTPLPASDASDGPPAFRTVVVVRRYGDAIFPVDLDVTFTDGVTVRERWDGRDRWKIYTYERAARARHAQVDPGRTLLLDVDTTNNGRTLRSRAGEAATKWTLKWMIWLQDLMVTYAFFV